MLTVKGNIVPVVADYIDHGIARAENEGSAACIIELDTPGGLLDVTQKIVTRILNAKVPVVVYVAPQGAWAASAGTFITLSAHITAMAPATSIGAAHPVGAQGESLPEIESQKATEYTAAWIQSIAEKRGRDPKLVEAHYNLAVAMEQMGRIPGAIAHYEEAARLKPDFAAARKALRRLRGAAD